VNEKGVRCIAIDYAQLLMAKGKSDTERVTAVSQALRAVINETQCAMFVLAQLSREIEKRESFIPKLSDLRQSGQLEQDADVISFLVWPHRIDSKKPPKDFQIWIAKNRMRGIGEPMVECQFTPSRLRIAEAIQPLPEYTAYEPRYEEREFQSELDF
jgi:replicative DNA helicase